jgi:hypothetical protein
LFLYLDSERIIRKNKRTKTEARNNTLNRKRLIFCFGGLDWKRKEKGIEFVSTPLPPNASTPDYQCQENIIR